MTSNFTKFRDQSQKKEEKRSLSALKSILKGFPNEEYIGEETVKEDFRSEEKMINNINGNIVHVTVNNFINTEKKP